jgi:hypothetical protein
MYVCYWDSYLSPCPLSNASRSCSLSASTLLSNHLPKCSAERGYVFVDTYKSFSINYSGTLLRASTTLSDHGEGMGMRL